MSIRVIRAICVLSFFGSSYRVRKSSLLISFWDGAALGGLCHGVLINVDAWLPICVHPRLSAVCHLLYPMQLWAPLSAVPYTVTLNDCPICWKFATSLRSNFLLISSKSLTVSCE